MTNKFSFILVSSVTMLSAALFAEYKIEVCLIPLRSIVANNVKPFTGSLQHMFVRGDDGETIIGLNFEPKNPHKFLNSEAKIGTQNYPSAVCLPIFTTSDESIYRERWDNMVAAFEEESQSHSYDLLTYNCQSATKKILRKLNYQIPEKIQKQLRSQRLGIFSFSS